MFLRRCKGKRKNRVAWLWSLFLCFGWEKVSAPESVPESEEIINGYKPIYQGREVPRSRRAIIKCQIRSQRVLALTLACGPGKRVKNLAKSLLRSKSAHSCMHQHRLPDDDLFTYIRGLPVSLRKVMLNLRTNWSSELDYTKKLLEPEQYFNLRK